MSQRITVAVVVKDGRILSYGTNEHKEPCNRIGYPTGVGYDRCKWCDYDNHAEANALRKTRHIAGATLYLIGHTYACEPCKEKAEKAGAVIKII